MSKYNPILAMLEGFEIPRRLREIVAWYLLSLMVPSAKHSQTFAAELSGRRNALFSNLVRNHLELSRATLNRAARRRLEFLMRKRKKIVSRENWTIVIIIDSTLHLRHGQNCDNAQKFNHGKGFNYGHQWTNIGILINAQLTPLPPIPFMTKKKCAELGIDYETEHDKLLKFITELDLQSLIGSFDNAEILFLMDSGYDDKRLLNAIRERGWNSIVSLKNSRVITVEGEDENWINIEKKFATNVSQEELIRAKTDGAKTKEFIVKQLERARLRGVHHDVKLVCSKKTRDKDAKHLVCSKLGSSAADVIAAYSLRWAIEIFHRDVKSYLGLQHAGVQSFDALQAHVNWVYCAYILLLELELAATPGIQSRQQYIQRLLDTSRHKAIIQLLTRFNGKQQVKDFCTNAIDRITG